MRAERRADYEAHYTFFRAAASSDDPMGDAHVTCLNRALIRLGLDPVDPYGETMTEWRWRVFAANSMALPVLEERLCDDAKLSKLTEQEVRESLEAANPEAEE